MKTSLNTTPTFKGQIKLTTYTNDRVPTISRFITTKAQDSLIKRVGNSMCKIGTVDHRLLENESNDFLTLIETIIGSIIPKNIQPKYLTNGLADFIGFRSKNPQWGGMNMDINLKSPSKRI